MARKTEHSSHWKRFWRSSPTFNSEEISSNKAIARNNGTGRPTTDTKKAKGPRLDSTAQSMGRPPKPKQVPQRRKPPVLTGSNRAIDQKTTRPIIVTRTTLTPATRSHRQCQWKSSTRVSERREKGHGTADDHDEQGPLSKAHRRLSMQKSQELQGNRTDQTKPSEIAFDGTSSDPKRSDLKQPSSPSDGTYPESCS